MIIRNARPEDVDAIIRIEAICFPAAEAAKAEDIRARYAAFPENFLPSTSRSFRPLRTALTPRVARASMMGRVKYS